jgi:hypothetical protein
MESQIKVLIERLTRRKNNEMACFAKYKNEGLQELMLISTGKLMELDNIIRELKVMSKNTTKSKNYWS